MLSEGFLPILNPEVDGNLLSQRSCGVRVVPHTVSRQGRWTVLLPPLWFQCLSDRPWERRRNLSDKTAKGRDLRLKYCEWRPWDKKLLTSIPWCSQKRVSALQAGLQALWGRGMDLRYLSPETEQEFSHIGISWIKYKRKKPPQTRTRKVMIQASEQLLDDVQCKTWGTYWTMSIKEDLDYTESSTDIQRKIVMWSCNQT